MYIHLSAEVNVCIYIHVCLSMRHIDSAEVDIRVYIYVCYNGCMYIYICHVCIHIYIFVMYVYIYMSSAASTLPR